MAVTMLLALVSYSIVAFSIPTTTPATATDYRFVDTFDTLNSLTAGLVPAIQPVGKYGALEYQGIVYFAASVAGALVKPPSAPNVISSGVATRILQGTNPALVPANSTVTSFDFTSIYYLCALNTEASLGALVDCKIQFTGIDATTGEEKREIVAFDAKLLGNKYAFAAFGAKLTNLKRLNIQIVEAPGGDVLTVPVFDNVTYTAHIEK